MGTLRQSNLELLRIVAMLLVLVVHADFLAFGKPDIAQIGSNPCASWLSYWVEAFAIVCVDLFVLLSGYFGIVWRFKSLGAYLFQVLFFAAGICLAYYAAVRIPPPLTLLSPSSWPGYWFAVHYFLLYLIAPVLNLLVDRCSRRGLQILLLLFFLVQTYCWYTDDLLFLFKNGYSVVSFVGLYLFARYIRLYAPRWSRNRRGGYLAVYAASAAFTVGCVWLSSRLVDTDIFVSAIGKFFDYNAPIVIVGTVALFLFFTKIEMRPHPGINRIAASAFAVYLLHCHPLLLPCYTGLIVSLREQVANPVFFVVMTMCALALVFTVATGIDRIRILLWQFVCRVFRIE